MLIIRKDMLERVPKELSTMFKYTTYSENNSLYNTPPCFSIYVCELVLKWIEETIGGLDRMKKRNDVRRPNFSMTTSTARTSTEALPGPIHALA